MYPLLTKIAFSDLIDHLFAAQRYWYGVLPGIHEEQAEALIEAKKEKPELTIELVIDPQESAFRSHYGDASAISQLLEVGVTIKEIPGHRLGFIISDQSSFILFMQSRAIEKEPDGYNAIRMSAVTTNELLLHFFGRRMQQDMQEEYVKEMRELVRVKDQVTDQGMTDFTPALIDEEVFIDTAYNLHHNPPPNPDFKRMYDVYTTKIKFVEFEVHGIKMDQKTIPITNEILNLADENLRNQISTRLRLFDSELQEEIKKRFSELAKRVESIRGSYLKRVTSRNKSVIKATHLEAFKKEVETFSKEYEKIQKEIESTIHSSLIKLKKSVKEEILGVLKQSPPDRLKKFREHDQYLLFLEDHADNEAKKIRFPTAESLMNTFNVEKRIFDPTYEDFKDQVFIKELEDIGFISTAERQEIVDEFRAMGLQPEEE
jgi:hypothetical protein